MNEIFVSNFEWKQPSKSSPLVTGLSRWSPAATSMDLPQYTESYVVLWTDVQATVIPGTTVIPTTITLVLCGPVDTLARSAPLFETRI